jgi:dTDP-4-dehydrorhamnose reductase
MRVLITGGAGLLGRALLAAAPAGLDVHATRRRPGGEADAATHAVDLAERDAVDALVGRLRPDLVLHTAYGTVDGERDIWLATRNVADACAASGAALLHMSTDALLSGARSPYDEDAPAEPVHDYGRWKARAEAHVRAALPSAAVVRTSLIVQVEPPDRGTASLLDALRAGARPAYYVDELRCPIAAADLAAQLWEIAALPAGERGGTWNLAGPEAVSRYAHAVLTAVRFGLDPSAIVAVPSSASPVPRPRDLRLSTARADRALRTRARGISEVLAPPGEGGRQA